MWKTLVENRTKSETKRRIKTGQKPVLTIHVSQPTKAALLHSDILLPSFIQTLESRRSRRSYGKTSISIKQLGTFLYRTARITRTVEEDETTYAKNFRPYPSGGALHELELYLTVSSCEGLAQGFYHYDPLAHALSFLGPLTEGAERNLLLAKSMGHLECPPQIHFTIAARFDRSFWKYGGISYKLILGNVGTLYQTMYLTATAMGLSPLALGSGDSDLFAEIAGLDYYQEGSVGEFLLGSGTASIS